MARNGEEWLSNSSDDCERHFRNVTPRDGVGASRTGHPVRTMPNPDALDRALVQWPDTLRVSMSADGGHVRLLRRRLAEWLGSDHLDEDLIDDLVMATSEALENCCDHAYVGAEPGGTMTLTACHADDRLVITVADDGSWQEAATEPTGRGRGLDMMRALVDDVAIEARPEGTLLALTCYV